MTRNPNILTPAEIETAAEKIALSVRSQIESVSTEIAAAQKRFIEASDKNKPYGISASAKIMRNPDNGKVNAKVKVSHTSKCETEEEIEFGGQPDMLEEAQS